MTGPRPVQLQVSGHGVEVRVSAPASGPAVVHGIAFRVMGRRPLGTAPGKVSVLVTGTVNIPMPQIRVWLDEPDQMTPGPVPLSLPDTVPAGESRVYRLTAHTREHDVEWQLGVEVSTGGDPVWRGYPIRTTAETGWRIFHPDRPMTENANSHREPDRPEIAAGTEATHRAGAEQGDHAAMYRLAVSLAERGELAEAQRWFHTCAERGDTEAAAAVASILELRGEAAAAEEWHRRAAGPGGS
ncbi:tetratricopeptide repeat protein [Kitasatospora sp. MMS16-BH015]|uniref:tetratricopeptide repeat protein n=1 Tax=Kitasatospora sp. MMS16-BH015 TaxID=2018025 RepID=UPI00131A5BD0|nr:tetratricopeptide repeat protein [Kitasatospora sp. MMS16-BH015]